ncbi:MAG: arginase family protein [Anaerolineales bacterium]|nr:arginase family protein [Anaerolineales bacterium]
MAEEGTHGLWGDLHRPDLTPEQTDFSVIGIPFDGLASARKGAARAPERLRYWSRHLTPFSEDRTRLKDMTICDLGDIPITAPESDFVLVRQKVASLPNMPIFLGGDHWVSIPVLEAERERFKTSASAFFGWTLTPTCVTSSTVRAYPMPTPCVVHWNSASNRMMYAW